MISNIIVEEVYINNSCDLQIYDATTCGYYIIQQTKFPVVLKGPWIRTEFDPPVIIPTGILVCEAKYCNSTGVNYFWYHEPPEDLTVLVKMKQMVYNKGVSNCVPFEVTIK